MWSAISLCESWCNSASIIVVAAIVLATLNFLRKPKKFPPGPRGLPIVGYTPFLGDNAAESLRKMKSKYGSIMSLQVGREDWVVLNDYNAIIEAIVKQGEKFSGRTSNVVIDFYTNRSGIIMVDYGPEWKTLRKFGLMTLRGFGVGKKGMEQNILEETPYLIDSLMTKGKGSCKIKLTRAVSNIICRVTFGQRFNEDDKRFLLLMTMMQDFYSETLDNKLLDLMVASPALRYLPVFRGAFKRGKKEAEKFLDIFRAIVAEHRSNFDDTDIRDFIDAFLKEMDANRDPASFNDLQLLQYIRDLFEAGTETTSTTLSWAILAFMNYPECQEKIVKEIEDVIGDGFPAMKHKESMPYTSAFIQEIMRHRTLVPTSLMHKTSEEATLQGYKIPKNTPIIPNIWSVHFDPELFEDPTDFNPARFISKDGEFIKSKHVIPFSVGPRHCLGEQLANMEIFIFLAGIVQKLRIEKDPDHPPPPLSSGTYNFLATFIPPDFEVKFQYR